MSKNDNRPPYKKWGRLVVWMALFVMVGSVFVSLIATLL